MPFACSPGEFLDCIFFHFGGLDHFHLLKNNILHFYSKGNLSLLDIFVYLFPDS